jgi:molybdenum cofactor cytidylyltransferase
MIIGIILAAGESKRMGTPKQLLPWGETIILQRVADVAAASKLDMVLVILGSRAKEIAPKIKLPPKTFILFNNNYREGMDSTVKCGIKNSPTGTEAYMLLLGDQPQISMALIDRLIETYRSDKRGIVMPYYNGKSGHPVIFDAKYREELLAISDRGAKEVVENHADEIVEVIVNSADVLTDIDTPQEYREALKMMEKE